MIVPRQSFPGVSRGRHAFVLDFPSGLGATSASPSAAGVLDAGEELSAHFARELHDQVAQPLVALILEIHEMRSRQPLSDPIAPDLLHIEEAARRVVRQTREMLIDLRGPHEIRLDFVRALRMEVARGGTVVPKIHASSRWPKHINGWAAFNLMRIAQEASANAVRHGKASSIDVFLDTNLEGEAVMVVIDDGAGIPDGPSGFGMIGMSERAVILGGTFTVAPRKAGGTRVEVRVPVARLE